MPEHPPATLPAMDINFKPLLEYRDNNEWAASEHGAWASKLGYNGVG